MHEPVLFSARMCFLSNTRLQTFMNPAFRWELTEYLGLYQPILLASPVRPLHAVAVIEFPNTAYEGTTSIKYLICNSLARPDFIQVSSPEKLLLTNTKYTI